MFVKLDPRSGGFPNSRSDRFPDPKTLGINNILLIHVYYFYLLHCNHKLYLRNHNHERESAMLSSSIPSIFQY